MATINFSHEVAFGKVEHKSLQVSQVLQNDVGISWRVGTSTKIIPYARVLEITIQE